MFQNKFNLLSIFGFLMLCVSLFALAVAWQLYQNSYGSYSDIYSSTSPSQRDFWEITAFLSFGITWLVSSICLILRQTWVRVLFTIVFTIGIFAWTALIFFSIKNQDRLNPIALGASTLIYGSMIFGILFLNNKYVLGHFGEEYQIKEEREDILDF